ncbi:MAG: transporter, partial [Flavobacteriaceae bacterium]|nr:transporter [Flavobacteriaceae bacterium]
IVSNNEYGYFNKTIPNFFDYSLNTPSKLTGSLAYIFGQNGLISFDYTYRDYTSTQLKPSSSFIDENEGLNAILNSTSSFKIGTEWRVKNFSFRGGYRYTESPYTNADSSTNITGYSLGVGIKLSRTINFDFAFDNTTYSDNYKFINSDIVKPASLDFDTKRFTSTLVVLF